MTPAHVSGRKVRAAVGQTIDQVAKQGEALEAVIADIGLIGERLAQHTELLSKLAESQKAHLDVLAVHSARLEGWEGMGLLARLRWLMRGNG